MRFSVFPIAQGSIQIRSLLFLLSESEMSNTEYHKTDCESSLEGGLKE